jgi:peptidoglycan/LPS O-acetylase OafA/YrhL
MKILATDISHRVFGFDLIRAFAILMVVFGHGDLIIRNYFPNSVNFFVIDGVDLFFVLSGFLIGNILLKSIDNNSFSKKKLFDFWRKRWLRTLPNYYLILAITLVYTIISTGNVGEFSLRYIFFFQNFHSSHPSFFTVAWSLSVEEWFYIFFPLGIFVLFIFFPEKNIKFISFIIILFLLFLPLIYRIKRGFFYYSHYPTELIFDSFIRKIVLTRLDTIGYGILGAYIYHYYPGIWGKYKFLRFFLGLTILYIVQYQIPFGFFHYTLKFSLISIGILLLFPLLSTLKSPSKFVLIPVTFISLISYSMYLIHYSLILNPILDFGKPDSEKSALLFYFIYIGTTILISALLYRGFEKPIMNLRNARYFNRETIQKQI